MVTPAAGNQPRQDVAEERAQAPIRWPHPNSRDVSLVGLWAVGIFVALFLPALFVAPTAKNPPHGDVWLAFGSTVVGSLIMLGAASLLWRRKEDASVMLMGAVPAVSCIAGGVILTATKLTGS
jgi:hypothetical protein